MFETIENAITKRIVVAISIRSISMNYKMWISLGLLRSERENK